MMTAGNSYAYDTNANAFNANTFANSTMNNINPELTNLKIDIMVHYFDTDD